MRDQPRQVPEQAWEGESRPADRLEDVLAEFLGDESAFAGTGRQKLLDDHPAFTAELAAFFEIHDVVRAIAGSDSRLPAVPQPGQPRPGGLATLPEPRDALSHGWSTEDASNRSGMCDTGSGAFPRRLGEYELLEQIGRGGMGIVYRARQLSLNRTVAVKSIHAGLLAQESARQRFRAEAEAAAKLQHPNIVHVYEVGQHEGQPFFSMPYVEGRNLAQVLSVGP